jgi:xylulokinase
MIVGADIGTQSLKAVVLAPDLSLIGSHAVQYRPQFPQVGWAEQDPLLWEQALGPAIAGALREASVAASEVTALGLAGQLDGVVAVDKAGAPLYPCIIWMDRRAEKEIQGIDAQTIRDKAGLVCDASHPAAKIAWLKAQGIRAHKYHAPVSYLVSRLTGAHVIDHATASTSMVYALKTRGYDKALLDLFGIARAELPEISEADDVAGGLSAQGSALTGLPKGIPVSAGTGDDFSSALGAGLTEPGRFIAIIGTAEVTGALHGSAVIDPQGLVETHAYPGGKCFIENPGWLSGGALTWFRDTFGLKDFDALTAAAATVPPGAGGVTFIPALSGAMAPEWIASARGCFYGMTPSHGMAHLARALLEGLAFAMRDVLDRVRALGVDANALLITGGGAKSALWRQIRADLCGVSASMPVHADTSPIGAALLTAKAAGVVGDLHEAAARANAVRETIEPIAANREAYEAAYRRYRLIFDSLRPMY